MGAVSSALAALIALVAITATQAPPPAIAELAPDATEQIKDAPQEQTSSVGEGDGGAGTGEAGAAATTTTSTIAPPPGATTTAPPAIVRARVRRCVGDPPRQIEDPQSPPCVPYWDGDNGGATARGVTADTIRVALPKAYESWPQMRGIVESFFNKRFEFYGRKIDLQLAGTQGDGDDTCVAFKAAAAELEAQNFFAVLDQNHGDAGCFYEELARRKMIGVPYGLFDEPSLQRLHPYTWQYMMSVDRIFANVGEMVCSRLAGGRAEHAKGLQLNQPRKFGIIHYEAAYSGHTDLGPLEQQLRACGVVPVVAHRRTNGGAAGLADDQSAAQRAVLQMQQSSVTSIVCLCTWTFSSAVSSFSSSQQYYPEWITSTYGLLDMALWVRPGFPQAEQRSQVLGVTTVPRALPHADEPYWWMVKEANPELREDQADQYGLNLIAIYRTMLVLASGIQMAGPNLTPETFAEGLQRTRFPNPPDHPNRPGKVGFLDGDHSMTDDAAEFWWSDAGITPTRQGSGEGGAGAICYLDQGARRDRGRWPRERAPFFVPPCFSGA